MPSLRRGIMNVEKHAELASNISKTIVEFDKNELDVGFVQSVLMYVLCHFTHIKGDSQKQFLNKLKKSFELFNEDKQYYAKLRKELTKQEVSNDREKENGKA